MVKRASAGKKQPGGEKTEKLSLKKQTLKDLQTPNPAGVRGGAPPLGTSGKNSVCNSCYKTDCCLIPP